MRKYLKYSFWFLMIFVQTTFSWNYTGHALTAVIAYDLLDSAKREEILALIKYHPRYQIDFLDKMPDEIKNAIPEIREKWIFAQIAVWPDLARGFTKSEKEKYHRGTWHYINLAVFPNDDLKEKYGDPPDVNISLVFENEEEKQNLNVMQALDKVLKALSEDSTSRGERAVYLCWVFHLIGDLHQPLHSTALFTPRIFKEGDRGGNLIKVGKYNLHSTWDWAIGGSRDISYISELSAEILNDSIYKTIKPFSDKQDIVQWLNESFETAEKYVYTKEVLEKVIQSEESNSDNYPSVELSEKYKDDLTKISKKRLIAAGVRLSSVLKKIKTLFG